MSRRLAATAACLGLAVSGCGDAAPGAPPAPGVSLALARARAREISDLSYDLRFVIPAARTEPIFGEALLRFRRTARGPLVIDFAAAPEQLRAIDANGDPLDLEPVDEHVVIPRSSMRRGENIIRISFLAGDGSLNRTDEFLYTLFVPDRARWAFPAFDQPDLKARFSLTLDVPASWRAVANGRELEVAGASRPGEGDRMIYRFEETEPLPTYLFSFAAGRFRVEEAERAGRTLRLFHRETDTAKVARNREDIFDLHATALAWLEEYTGIPYPFGKFDFVAVPSFQYGGMEHPGAILYRAGSLFLDESATQGELLGRASVIAHETAHMWFGDLVTMRWFDDVWMKEVFANFMAAKIVNPSFPELDHELRFLLAHHPAAYEVDRTEGANPIRQPLDNLNEAGTLYGAIIYQKAPIVMQQLELLVGEDGFREGLREYLATHAFRNATWPELIATLDRRSPLDLDEWSRTWVEQPGRPTVTTRLRAARGAAGRSAAVRVRFHQEDPLGRGLVWEQTIQPWIGSAQPLGAEPITLTREAEVSAPGPADFILPNGGGLGYGLFRQTDASRARLLEHLPDIPAAMPRAVAWLTLWDELLEGEVTPVTWIGLARRALEAEREELLVARMLGDVETAFWRFLTPEERAELAPALEALLWSRMEDADRPSLRASFFNAYRDLATSGDALDRLARVWARSGGIEGLPLSERDLTVLAQQLAVREVEGAERILDRQAERIENPDRRAEFDFVRPALSADTAVRDSFFRALSDPVNREREPWVLSALGFLHHPLREQAARPHLRPALELLEEIQRTGDIFFPKRWLDATLGGHSSPEAADVVRAFLAEHPDYPGRLRAKILQSSDLLFRAAALRDPNPGRMAETGEPGASD